MHAYYGSSNFVTLVDTYQDMHVSVAKTSLNIHRLHYACTADH